MCCILFKGAIPTSWLFNPIICAFFDVRSASPPLENETDVSRNSTPFLASFKDIAITTFCSFKLTLSQLCTSAQTNCFQRFAFS